MASSVSRRDFTRLFALGGSAALFADTAWARQAPPTTTLAGGPEAGEPFWASVRAQFVMPPDLGVLNAANLCPASRPVLEALTRETRSVDQDPSPQNRADPRQQFARAEGLRQIVVGAQFEPQDAVRFLARGAGHDHGRAVRVAQTPADRKPVLARQHEIQNDEVGLLLTHGQVHAAGVPRDADGIAVPRQIFGDRLL